MVDKLKNLKLERESKGVSKEKDKEEKAKAVSAGAVDKAIDLAFNPTRDKIREVTIIDRTQARLFPLIDLVNAGQQYILEIATYRQNRVAYQAAFERDRPLPPNFLDELLYRIAQWQKSKEGVNLTRITDIALAETEVRGAEDDPFATTRDPYEDR